MGTSTTGCNLANITAVRAIYHHTSHLMAHYHPCALSLIPSYAAKATHRTWFC